MSVVCLPSLELAEFPPDWPRKTRELHNHHFDSSIWNYFAFRDDDIVIATYAKSGTTWTQQIVGQLLLGPRPDLDIATLSPWLDLRIMPREERLAAVEAQTHRRFLKTHLPVDALVFSPLAKYIYVGRDGRDVVWSMFNHHSNANDTWYAALNHTPGRVGPPIERPSACVHRYYREWLAKNGHPFWPFWENVRTWWAVRALPNVHFTHFALLKADLPGEIRRLAEFLEVPLDESTLPRILEYCSFDHMKRHAECVAPLNGALWHGGGRTFVHKGVNGRWLDTLGEDEVVEYERKSRAELGHACANWLETGLTGWDMDVNVNHADVNVK